MTSRVLRAARQLHVSACLWGRPARVPQRQMVRFWSRLWGHEVAAQGSGQEAGALALLGCVGGLWCPALGLRAGVGPQRLSTRLAGWAALSELPGLGVLHFQGRSGVMTEDHLLRPRATFVLLSSEGRSGRAPQPPRRRGAQGLSHPGGHKELLPALPRHPRSYG